jgi:NADH dehydrogenase
MSDKTRVLILGGGFGGVYAALEFEKRNDERFEVTVVNRENFFLFTPMLHEIAASDLDLTNIVNLVRKMLPRSPHSATIHPSAWMAARSKPFKEIRK